MGPSEALNTGPDVHGMTDKQSLCVDILVNGMVNSFVDFFYLTHRSDDDAAARGEVPADQLHQIKDNLMKAEKAHRRGDSEKVYEAYETLATYFQNVSDFKTSIYFYEKCLDIAESMENLPQQAAANLRLGVVHDRMGNIAKGIEYHERHLEIAKLLGEAERLRTANRQLVEVYSRWADEHERKEDHAGAVELFKKCLQAAHAAGDVKAEGQATYKLGIALATMGDRQTSIEYQQRYYEVCKRTGDQIGEGEACAALANAFKEMNDMKLAVFYLEKHLDIATRNKQSVQQVEACSALGSIYSAQNSHEKAVSYFEKAFDIAKNVGDRKLIDATRIKLGMARGNTSLNAYMDVVNTDLPALLKWKTRRVQFKG